MDQTLKISHQVHIRYKTIMIFGLHSITKYRLVYIDSTIVNEANNLNINHSITVPDVRVETDDDVDLKDSNLLNCEIFLFIISSSPIRFSKLPVTLHSSFTAPTFSMNIRSCQEQTTDKYNI